jgi:hypothetical protein
MQPIVESLDLPKEYGTVTTTLDWDDVRERLEAAERYWMASTRPDGRPHVIPIDGVWLDGVWYFGGAPQTVHQQSVKANSNVVVHLEDTMAAVIVEGTAEWVTPSPDDAQRIADATKAKYGYPMKPDDYAGGLWGMSPRKVLAWNNFPTDCTRFRFDG